MVSFAATCHHGGARCFLCHRKEVVDDLDGCVELRKERIEVVLEDPWALGRRG